MLRVSKLLVVACLCLAAKASAQDFEPPVPVVVLSVGNQVIGVGTTETASRARFTITEKTQLPLIYIQNSCGRRRRLTKQQAAAVTGASGNTIIVNETVIVNISDSAHVETEVIGQSEQEDGDIGYEWVLGDGQCDSANQLSSSKRFSVYVRAAHHWERNVNFRLWRNAREVVPSGLSNGGGLTFVENSSKIVNEVQMQLEEKTNTQQSLAPGATLAPGQTLIPNKKKPKSYSALEPRIEMTKSCSEFLDECFMTKYFTYTKSFKYSGDVEEYDTAHPAQEMIYHHRLAARVDDAEWGRWNLRVANNLPHDAESSIEVIVVFTDKTWSVYLVAPLVFLMAFVGCGVCAGGLMVLKMVGLQRQQRRVASIQAQQHRDLRRRNRPNTTGSPPSTPDRVSLAESESTAQQPAAAAALPSSNVTTVAILDPRTEEESTSSMPEESPGEEKVTRTEKGNDQDTAAVAMTTRPQSSSPSAEEEEAQPEHQESERRGRSRSGGWMGVLYLVVGKLVAGLKATRSKIWQRGQRQRLPTDDASGNEEGRDADVVSNASSEEGDVCRICRMADPVNTLFSPCRCAGSSKFVHRECLAEWRAMTTNPEHRRVCAECKTPYRLVRKQNMSSALIGKGLSGFAQSAGKFSLTIGSLFLGGYILKGWFFLITVDMQIDWSPFSIYHVVLGFLLLVAMLSYYNVMVHFVDSYNPKVQFCFIFIAVLTTVPLFGYLGHYVMYITSHIVWSYEICFGSGIIAAYVCYSNIIEVLIARMESHGTETEEVADNLDVIFPGQRVHRRHSSGGDEDEEMEEVETYNPEANR